MVYFPQTGFSRLRIEIILNSMNQNLAIPVAIVVAGAIIAAALFFAGRGAAPIGAPNGQASGDPSLVPPVTQADHILGNPDAPIVVIEYSDIECPFCKQFHLTMKQIMSEYGDAGQVAWVYRNFPLTQLHPNAPRLAETAECVASVSGNRAYWNFLDEIFAIAPGNTQFPMNRLNEAVQNVGASVGEVEACVDAGTFRARVEKDFNDAVATGGQGTPHNIIVTRAGSVIPVPGAQPYNQMRAIIETIIQEEGY